MRRDGWRWFELKFAGADTALQLVRRKEDAPADTPVLVLVEENVEPTVRTLKSQGVKIITQPHRATGCPDGSSLSFRTARESHDDREQMMSKPPITASCKCGSVKFEATGKSIMSVVCYCDDCQEGARKIEMLPDALPVPDPDGGTAYLLYRKDRFSCIEGDQLLKGVRIRERSPTRRVVASCCNSAMFLDFEKGHWLSVYRARFTDDTPPVEMRIQTRFKPKDADIPNDAPAYPAFPLKFMAKLMSARIAMLLHR